LATTEWASLLETKEIMELSVSHSTVRTCSNQMTFGVILALRTKENFFDSIEHNELQWRYSTDSNANELYGEYRKTNIKIIIKLLKTTGSEFGRRAG